jgi:hypothetical protein
LELNRELRGSLFFDFDLLELEWPGRLVLTLCTLAVSSIRGDFGCDRVVGDLAP